MRDVLNLNPIEYQLDEYTVITFDSFPEYDKQDYDLDIPKEFAKYIRDIKSDIRKSIEYTRMMGFLKNNLDMNHCSFLKNIQGGNRSKIKIEIHHDPFTIEDIIRIVYRKRCSYLEDLEVEQVAKEVMYLHYRLMVGLVPLSTTAHELVGNNYLFIPTTHIMGNYKEFVERYKDFIDPETMAILQRIEEATLVYDETRAHDIFKRHYIYINIGDEELPTYETIIQMMKDRLDAIDYAAKVRQQQQRLANTGLQPAFIKVDP